MTDNNTTTNPPQPQIAQTTNPHPAVPPTAAGSSSSTAADGTPHAMVIDNNSEHGEHDVEGNNGAEQPRSHSSPRSKSGWDGKLRVEKNKPVIINPEALSDPEYSDEDAPPTELIEADEGEGVFWRSWWAGMFG